MLPKRHCIPLGEYPRVGILQAFKDRLMPQFSTTCEIDITGIKRACDNHDGSFFVALSYAVSRAVNAVPAFRQRIIDDTLYEFERVDPGYTVARENDLFSFCDAEYHEEFRVYRATALARMDAVKHQPDLSVGEKHHMFFITSIPWFSFTSFTHPYSPIYGYIPIITLGKYTERDGRFFMPVAVQVHHGVVDGVHVGRFYAALTELSENAGQWMAGEHESEPSRGA